MNIGEGGPHVPPRRVLSSTVAFALSFWAAGPEAEAAPFVRLKAGYTGAAPLWSAGDNGPLQHRPLGPGAVDFSKVPDTLALSYLSLPPAQQATAGLGDVVRSSNAGGYLDRVEAVLVTWAKASQWPAWSALNPDGYVHRVTAGIFEKVQAPNGAISFLLVAESSAWVQVPWRPLALADGSPYPYNGHAFKAVIPFHEGTQLPAEYTVLISYNTSKSGYQPLAVAGPYDTLNFALSEAAPLVGSDPDGGDVLWVKPDDWSYPSTNWGGFGTPMIKVVMRPDCVPTGLGKGSPVGAGSYHLMGDPGAGLEAFAVIEPARAGVNLEGLVTSKGRPFPGPIVTTDPPGLPWEVSYGGAMQLPSAIGVHPIEVKVVDSNFTGSASGLVTVTGPAFADWITDYPGVIQAAWDEDPDHDGLLNLVEYATDSDPGCTSPNPLRPANGGWRVSRGKSLPDCQFVVEESWDLLRWREISLLPQGEAGDMEEFFLPAHVLQESRFYRLRISPMAGAFSSGGPSE